MLNPLYPPPPIFGGTPASSYQEHSPEDLGSIAPSQLFSQIPTPWKPTSISPASYIDLFSKGIEAGAESALPPPPILESDHLCQGPWFLSPRLLSRQAYPRNMCIGRGDWRQHPSIPPLHLPEGRVRYGTRPLASSVQGTTADQPVSSTNSCQTVASLPARQSTSRAIPTTPMNHSNPLLNNTICAMGQTNDRNFAQFITGNAPDNHILGAGTGCNYFSRFIFRPVK